MNASATRLINSLLGRMVSTDAKPIPDRRKHKEMWRPGPSNFRGSNDYQFSNSNRITAGFHKS